MTLRDAASIMRITMKTANDHKCQLMFRLGLKSREELVEYVADYENDGAAAS
jgi:hypothetical protein